MSSPFSSLPTPRRRRSGSRTLGWVLGIVGAILAIMVAMGFGVDQQAKHHIASPTTLSVQHA